MDFCLLKSVIYYVTIVMMIIPHAKIHVISTCEDITFSGES